LLFFELGFLCYKIGISKVKEKQDYLGIEKPRISEENVIQFVFERFNNVKQTNKIKNLVDFQAANKYMLMSHDQEELKNLGNIVAKYKKISFPEILDYYELHLKKVMENPPTIKKHTNVIMHVFGFFSNDFNVHEKRIFFDLFEKYREKKISLGEILSEINPIIFRFNKTYLASQTYFLLYSNLLPGNIFKL
jgi:uncharacterized protein YbgA (DUF1722 family)